MNKKTFYITTPIYYASGNLHIGHLYTTTLAWVLANYKKLQGYDTKLLTGSDEHGQKIFEKALEQNKTPQEFVDLTSNKFIKMWKDFKIDVDYFSRTTDTKHKAAVQKIFNHFFEKGYIYKDKYEGWYSVSDEEFLTETQAIKKDNKLFHPTSGHELKFISEESYFFNLNKFTDWLEEYISTHPTFLSPQKTLNEIHNNFLNNLSNLSVTRTNVKWGIPVSFDESHTIYVWLDALFNYITKLGFDIDEKSEDFVKYWENGDEIVHILGKEIARFHFVYWPIFLKALDLKQPNKIQSHGWIITPTGKMSKSKNNVVDPYDLLSRYHPEMIKYFLSSQLPLGEDGIFDEERFKNIINAELINNFGNLVSRTLKMKSNSFSRPIKYQTSKNSEDIEIEQNILDSIDKYTKFMDDFKIDKGLQVAVELGNQLNKYIDVTQPWTLKEDLVRLEQILVRLLNGIYACATYFSIVLPEKINDVSIAMGNVKFSMKNIQNFNKFDNIDTAEKFMFFERLK